MLAGKTIVFFRQGDALHLRVDQSVIELNGDISVQYCRVGETHTLQVVSRRDGSALLRLDYTLPLNVVPVGEDPTPFVEDEDFDFGLFIANVVNNPERSAIIYR
jgi:hypothetical protein